MLTLTRPQRHVVATIGLLLSTVAPTVYVGYVSWKINRPGHLRDVEVELGRELGLQVSLKEVRHPRPGEDVLRGVVFRHEEPRGKTFAEVARAEAVRVHRKGGEMVVEARGLVVRGEGPRQAIDQASALLSRAGEGPWKRVSLSAPTCEIELGDGGPGGLGYSVREVAATFQAEAGSPVVRASYRMLGDGPTTRCELTLTRDRSARPIRTTIALETKEGPPLPARVLDPYFSSAEWLGPEARVAGALTLQKAGEQDWEAEFRGDLLDLDLAALVSRWFPDHRLGGVATVRVRSARWAGRPGGQGPGWVEADGTLAAGPGAISPSLLEALKAEMKFKLDPKLAGRGEDVPFQALGLSFAMAADGQLRLGGNLGTEFPAGAVLIDGTQGVPIAGAPGGMANVRGLWNALFPRVAGSVLISETRDSLLLRKFLPAPPAREVKAAVGN